MMREIRTFLTPQELAEKLKVSRAAISQWCCQGKIPFYRFGKSVRFDPEEIMQWLKEKKNLEK